VILDHVKLDDQVAVVTGGNRDLDLGIATALAEASADSVSIEWTEETSVLEDAVARAGRRVLPLALDLAADGSAEAALAATARHFGRVDILVNNAGVQRRAPAADFSLAD